MPDIYDAIVGSIGLEIEAELVEDRPYGNFRTAHDASVQTPTIRLGSLPHCYFRRAVDNTRVAHSMLGDRTYIGTEFVSGIYIDLEEIGGDLGDLLGYLATSGENPRNLRSGFHVHIGWAYDLRILKRTVELVVWLESLLFHLGGMGYEFRGTKNESAYCRPFTLFGPPIAVTNLGCVQITNIDALLSANTIRSFWNRYGGINLKNLPKRYTPQRYMGVNLFSAFLHKTLEFRMFNTTLNSEYAIAITKLCREITLLTLGSSKVPDEMNSVYTVGDRGANHEILSRLLGMINIDVSTEKILREILERSPVPVINGVFVQTHIQQDRAIEFDKVDLLPIINLYPQIKEYSEPAHVDAHVLDRRIMEAELRAIRDDIPNKKERDRAVRRLREAGIDVQDEEDEDENEEENELFDEPLQIDIGGAIPNEPARDPFMGRGRAGQVNPELRFWVDAHGAVPQVGIQMDQPDEDQD